MFHKKRRSMMGMNMDMDTDMMSVSKMVAAGAMVYFGAKMLWEEMME